MARPKSASLVLVASLALASPSLASAQATIEGQIIIQEATPTTGAPPPQATIYVAPPTAAPQSVYVTPSGPAQAQCPAGAVVQMDRFGRPMCMMERTVHRTSSGLLGGGIAMLAGGYVSSVVTTLFSGILFAFGTGFGYTSSDLSNYITFGFIPLIGPWVQMGFLPRSTDGGLYAWLAVEGLLQAGGLVMLIFGALGNDVLEYQPVPGYALRFSPILSPTTQGVSAELRF